MMSKFWINFTAYADEVEVAAEVLGYDIWDAVSTPELIEMLESQIPPQQVAELFIPCSADTLNHRLSRGLDIE
jgi:hypothetical protein